MLKRAGTFKTDGLIFVKTVKHNQDYRFDVLVFDLRTLELMAEYNILTAVLNPGDVIVVENVPSEATRSKILEAAKRHKIQLIGF